MPADILASIMGGITRPSETVQERQLRCGKSFESEISEGPSF